jgi:hypothetical protein
LGYVVVGSGGGGIPIVRDDDGTLRGVEAVIDKDLAAALLARSVDVDVLVIATDVDHAILDFGTDRPPDRPGHDWRDACPCRRRSVRERQHGSQGRGCRALRRAGRDQVGDHVVAAHRRRGHRTGDGPPVGTVIENT